MWLIATLAHAAPLHTTDPVFDGIPHLAARTGAIITLETAPDSHRAEPSPFELDLPAPRADAAGGALEALVEAARTWEHADGCTSYAVTRTPLGFHVAPTQVVEDGACVPYRSPLEVTLAPEGGVFHGDTMINALFQEHHLSVSRPFGELRVPAGGLTAREVLDQLIARAGDLMWRMGPTLSDGSHVVALLQNGRVSPTGLDLAEYPFHPEHARRERERAMSPEERAQRQANVDEAMALLAEWDRLRGLGLSQDEANAELLEQELERDGVP
ncbi:MAG: hypothetical protein R3F61_05610 [Myxococcota bacterium]